MREFFDKILNDWSGLTESANRVEALSQQVQQLSDRITALEQENHNLRNEVENQRKYAQDMEALAVERANSFHDAQEHAHVLQETIVQADTRVNELSGSLGVANSQRHEAERERDEARNSVRDYEVLTADLRQQLSDITVERDNWKLDAQKNAETIVSLNATLGRVKAFLSPEPETVVEFPQYNVG